MISQFKKPRRTRRGSVLSDFGSGYRVHVPSGPPGTQPGAGSEVGTGGVTAPMLAPGSVGLQAIQPGAFDITAFASTIRPIQIVTSLPTLPDTLYPNESVVILTTDHKLYRNAAGTWTKATDGTDITTDSITAGQIAAGAIGASEIAAGAVTTEKLTVGILKDSAIFNGSFEEVSAADATRPARWNYNSVWGTGSTALSTADRQSGDRSLLLNPGTGVASYNPVAENVPVVPGETWFVSCWAKGTGSGVSGFYLRARGGATANANGTEITLAVENIDVPATWTKYEGVVTIPAGMFWAGPMLLNYSTNTGKGVYVDDVTFQKAVGTANIIDANIVNAKIANLTLTADKYFQVRNVIQIPFDDSVDSTHPLECFFQMPSGVVTVKSAKVWVQQKSFRAYSTAATSGGGSTSGSGGATTSSSGGSQTPTSSSPSANHAHTTTSQAANTGVASAPISDGHWHGYNDATAQQTGANNLSHTHSVTISAHDHTVGSHSHSTPDHAHSITYGIFEQAAAGTLSLKVADDGTTYGADVVSGVTSITAQAITLSTTAGDRRIKLTATGLQRIQVLIVMDLILQLGAP